MLFFALMLHSVTFWTQMTDYMLCKTDHDIKTYSKNSIIHFEYDKDNIELNIKLVIMHCTYLLGYSNAEIPPILLIFYVNTRNILKLLNL